MKAKYIDTGQVRLVSRDLPLPVHNNAEQVAYAARCADEQGKYWEMREVMFQNISALDDGALLGYAAALGLDRAGFEVCLGSGKYQEAVRADAAAAGPGGCRRCSPPASSGADERRGSCHRPSPRVLAKSLRARWGGGLGGATRFISKAYLGPND